MSLKAQTHHSTAEARALCQSVDAFAHLVDTLGAPPIWKREASFSTLIHIILEQQVSLASALAAFKKLNQLSSPITPEAFLNLDDVTLKAAYFSKQKIRYGRALATALLDHTLSLEALESLSDDDARAELTKIVGIGRWTADIYLMMALQRKNIWPKGDVALATAAKEVFKLESRPNQDDLESMAEAWQPHRSIAAKLLWHYYLSRNQKV